MAEAERVMETLSTDIASESENGQKWFCMPSLDALNHQPWTKKMCDARDLTQHNVLECTSLKSLLESDKQLGF